MRPLVIRTRVAGARFRGLQPEVHRADHLAARLAILLRELVEHLGDRAPERRAQRDARAAVLVELAEIEPDHHPGIVVPLTLQLDARQPIELAHERELLSGQREVPHRASRARPRDVAGGGDREVSRDRGPEAGRSRGRDLELPVRVLEDRSEERQARLHRTGRHRARRVLVVAVGLVDRVPEREAKQRHEVVRRGRVRADRDGRLRVGHGPHAPRRHRDDGDHQREPPPQTRHRRREHARKTAQRRAGCTVSAQASDLSRLLRRGRRLAGPPPDAPGHLIIESPTRPLRTFAGTAAACGYDEA